MADKLVTTQYDFLRSVVRSADRSLRGRGRKKRIARDAGRRNPPA